MSIKLILIISIFLILYYELQLYHQFFLISNVSILIILLSLTLFILNLILGNESY